MHVVVCLYFMYVCMFMYECFECAMVIIIILVTFLVNVLFFIT